MADTYHFAFDIRGGFEWGDPIRTRQHFFRRVERFNGIEGVSRPFHFEIYLAQEGGLAYDDTLIGRPATLHIRRGNNGDVQRDINGLVSRFLFLGYSGNITAYYVELVPSIWYLTQRQQSRIFQDMTVLEIIEDVLKEDAEYTEILYDLNSLWEREKYKKREFCVQYRESDFDFISRLMEEEGIFFFFKHHKEPVDSSVPPAQRPYPYKHTLVLGNDPTCYRDIIDKEGTEKKNKTKVKYSNSAGLASTEEHIYDFSCNFQICPSKVMLGDHNYRQNCNFTSSSKPLSSRFHFLQFYDYPGKFDEAKEGERLANIRIAEKRTKYESGIGHSNCLRLIPGYCFTLDEHENETFNHKHLLLTVSHTGRQSSDKERTSSTFSSILDLIDKGIDALLDNIPKLGPLSAQQLYHEYRKGLGELINKNELFYSNEFQCVRSDVYFRPPRLTPKPVVHGPQTATVVGDGEIKKDKKNKELFMDELGRTKVQFHWDRREKSETNNCSCWIRVASNYAGEAHGIQFNPLVGDEVVVVFLEGDPDKPLIVGSVYNGENRPPLSEVNSIENVILTPYQHRLLFSDLEKKITLNTGGGEQGKKKESLTMYDEDSKYGDAIYLKTADNHRIYLLKNKENSQVSLITELGHDIVLSDSPRSGIFMMDKTNKLLAILDSEKETIVIENQTDKQIIIKCPKGNVSVIGGGVNVVGGEVNITGTTIVHIKSDSDVNIEAPVINLTGKGFIALNTPLCNIVSDTIKLDTPEVECTGTIKCKSLITGEISAQDVIVLKQLLATSIQSPSYTPGVGNIL
jgi:type VI secretion system VgrG family protein